MNRTTRTTSSWGYGLQQSLRGSFTARAHGLLKTQFTLLDTGGREFGRLRLRGLSVAGFESGNYAAILEKSGVSYRMVADGEEVLTAAPRGRSIDKLEVSCVGRAYEVRASFFRNLAIASYRKGGERVVRVSGGLMSRSYEALFDAEDRCAIPVAVFLLWHVAANRRRAYRMWSPAEGGAM